MRRITILALACALIPLAGAADGPDPVRIAVIDTGIDASHPEFLAGQVIAWRDFTAENSATPQDGHGHGTATASLVAGLNLANCGTGLGDRKVSFAPGADLIIARVGDDAGAITGSVEGAIDWAREQGADVISMSLGVSVPLQGARSAAINRANAAGIVVVVSAGNGLLNAGAAPYPAWMSAFGNNREAIVVGASDRTGQALTSTTGNSDPDVVSWGDNVCVARANTRNYTRMSGTSFSAPLVAGMAGGLKQISQDAGRSDDRARIEELLLKGASNNPITPYLREGLGHLVVDEFNKLKEHAAAGTTPDYLAQGPEAEVDWTYYTRTRTTLRE